MPSSSDAIMHFMTLTDYPPPVKDSELDSAIILD
jgi:hypothetical protein